MECKANQAPEGRPSDRKTLPSALKVTGDQDLPGQYKFRQNTHTQPAEQQRLGTLLLDTRPAEEFASLHIRGAIQIGLMGNFSSWAAILIDPTRELLLVAESESSAAEAHARLARV